MEELRRSGTGLIYRGAEADLFKGKWHGLDAVRKVRKPMKYRIAALDSAIRRQRTVHEAQMLHLSKAAGVKAPFVYDVDPVGATITMEFLTGPRLEDAATAEGADYRGLFSALGGNVATLHAGGIVHGDLTTANVILSPGGMALIDFGLATRSEKVEDHAVDLRLIKETIAGAHSNISRGAVDALVEGYRGVRGGEATKRVLGQLANIERRGRYARVV